MVSWTTTFVRNQVPGHIQDRALSSYHRSYPLSKVLYQWLLSGKLYTDNKEEVEYENVFPVCQIVTHNNQRGLMRRHLARRIVVSRGNLTCFFAFNFSLAACGRAVIEWRFGATALNRDWFSAVFADLADGPDWRRWSGGFAAVSDRLSVDWFIFSVFWGIENFELYQKNV